MNRLRRTVIRVLLLEAISSESSMRMSNKWACGRTYRTQSETGTARESTGVVGIWDPWEDKEAGNIHDEVLKPRFGGDMCIFQESLLEWIIRVFEAIYTSLCM